MQSWRPRCITRMHRGPHSEGAIAAAADLAMVRETHTVELECTETARKQEVAWL